MSNPGTSGGDGTAVPMDQVDQVVRQRLEQAFNSAFGRLLRTSERAAEAAEQQAAQHKSEGLAKALKLEAWKPASREEELRTWREWYFQLSTYVIAMDPDYAKDQGLGGCGR